MEGIYKGRYLIGLYNKPEVAGNDEAVAIFDNCRQLAAYIGKSITSTMNIAKRRLTSHDKDIEVGGKVYELHFIDFYE